MSSLLSQLVSWSQQLPANTSRLKERLDNLLTPPVPAEVLASPAACLVHVSDTPAVFYPYLFRLLKKLRPAVLIHTGDLMDQIKLENNAYLSDFYQEQIQRYLPQLERMPVGTIYLIPGNHDNTAVLTHTCQRSQVLPASSLVQFGSLKIGVAHEPQHLPAGADFGLYGHCPDQPPAVSGHPLSGLTKINLLLANGTIYSLPYPHGMDAARGLKTRPQKL